MAVFQIWRTISPAEVTTYGEDEGAYIHDTFPVARKDQIALKVLIPRSFVESTRGDHLITFDVNVLLQYRLAIECPQRYFGPSAEHDDARHIIDTSTLHLP